MRYRILLDLSQDDTPPCGLVVERPDCVEIISVKWGEPTKLTNPYKWGEPTKLTNPYCLLNPDLSVVEVEPGDPRYFNSWVYDLSRHFAIGPERTYGDH